MMLYDYIPLIYLPFRAPLEAYGCSKARVESDLQMQAFATDIATVDPSHICGLHRSSQQCQIINPLSEARYWTGILMDLMDTSHACLLWATMGSPCVITFLILIKLWLIW